MEKYYDTKSVMKKEYGAVLRAGFIYSVILSLIVNSYIYICEDIRALFIIIPVFLFINVCAGMFVLKTRSRRDRISYHGALLLRSFTISLVICIIYHIALAFVTIPDNYKVWVWSAVMCYCMELIVFWNGIICVYVTSKQMGIGLRVVGAICGMIPIVNLIVLNRIIKTVVNEVCFEAGKERINLSRKDAQICKTKYPILLVHGVFFRDSEFFNYWGRIPDELEKNGATLYYGNHESAASIGYCANELAQKVKTIINETGCEKVNIIAHSKGGLDCRYMISHLGVAPLVASLTTINTPHRGCIFADYLLNNIPEETKNKVADAYNSAVRNFGDKNPDFLEAMNNLTASFCAEFDRDTILPEGIYSQSVGSVLKNAVSGKFPLNFTYHLVKHFDGANDGLVSDSAYKWGEDFTMLYPKHKRGISHGDMIDLNRENIEGFDVREFYVELVSKLKDRGL